MLRGAAGARHKSNELADVAGELGGAEAVKRSGAVGEGTIAHATVEEQPALSPHVRAASLARVFDFARVLAALPRLASLVALAALALAALGRAGLAVARERRRAPRQKVRVGERVEGAREGAALHNVVRHSRADFLTARRGRAARMEADLVHLRGPFAIVVAAARGRAAKVAPQVHHFVHEGRGRLARRAIEQVIGVQADLVRRGLAILPKPALRGEEPERVRVTREVQDHLGEAPAEKLAVEVPEGAAVSRRLLARGLGARRARRRARRGLGGLGRQRGRLGDLRKAAPRLAPVAALVRLARRRRRRRVHGPSFRPRWPAVSGDAESIMCHHMPTFKGSVIRTIHFWGRLSYTGHGAPQGGA